jgi:hypothetical protein
MQQLDIPTLSNEVSHYGNIPLNDNIFAIAFNVPKSYTRVSDRFHIGLNGNTDHVTKIPGDVELGYSKTSFEHLVEDGNLRRLPGGLIDFEETRMKNLEGHEDDWDQSGWGKKYMDIFESYSK